MVNTFLRFGAIFAAIMLLSGLLRWLVGATGGDATFLLVIGQTILQFILGGIVGVVLRAGLSVLIRRGGAVSGWWHKSFGRSAAQPFLGRLLGLDRDGNKVG